MSGRTDMPANLYVRLIDDGQHIRKWDRKPFEGATSYTRSDCPTEATFGGIPLSAHRDGLGTWHPGDDA